MCARPAIKGRKENPQTRNWRQFCPSGQRKTTKQNICESPALIGKGKNSVNKKIGDILDRERKENDQKKLAIVLPLW